MIYNKAENYPQLANTKCQMTYCILQDTHHREKANKNNEMVVDCDRQNALTRWRLRWCSCFGHKQLSATNKHALKVDMIDERRSTRSSTIGYSLSTDSSLSPSSFSSMAPPSPQILTPKKYKDADLNTYRLSGNCFTWSIIMFPYLAFLINIALQHVSISFILDSTGSYRRHVIAAQSSPGSNFTQYLTEEKNLSCPVKEKNLEKFEWIQILQPSTDVHGNIELFYSKSDNFPFRGVLYTNSKINRVLTALKSLYDMHGFPHGHGIVNRSNNKAHDHRGLINYEESIHHVQFYPNFSNIKENWWTWFPTYPRDLIIKRNIKFVDTKHQIIVFSQSVSNIDAIPPVRGHIRANLSYAKWILTDESPIDLQDSVISVTLKEISYWSRSLLSYFHKLLGTKGNIMDKQHNVGKFPEKLVPTKQSSAYRTKVELELDINLQGLIPQWVQFRMKRYFTFTVLTSSFLTLAFRHGLKILMEVLESLSLDGEVSCH